ncbi:MAG TPA: NAD-dependent epimerase/dehydratase family protein [Rudaea sp.]|jgi:nucleoside-diphosphate-sugar epimerase|nr:NAD-dependent epimerase/dehydratase family protein [Rudaea sp.]
MIIGSGLIATAFRKHVEQLPPDATIYAAGVSNSSCNDPREFMRERERMLAAIADTDDNLAFAYFSTCSVEDPASKTSAYVLHKAAMEQLVRGKRARHFIFRLPQLAGFTPNPHTLLNYLFSRIARSERFQIWNGAHRNIIDVDDVVRLASDVMRHHARGGETINIACTHSTSIRDIVSTLEDVLECRAIFDAIDRGDSYPIDVERMRESMQRTGVSFPDAYLRATIEKYYGHRAPRDA